MITHLALALHAAQPAQGCPIPGSAGGALSSPVRSTWGQTPGGCRGPVHWVFHWLGLDTQQSYQYAFWSGIATQLTLVVMGVSAYRHINCRQRWCWRRGRFPLTDPASRIPRNLCWRHHPGVEHKHWHARHIAEAWARAQQQQPPASGGGTSDDKWLAAGS